MSNYSMTAHMFLNLLWLFCYIQPNPRWFVAVPLIGALAMGLHQPHCHVLFVAPFLFRLLLEKKWQKVLYAGFVYSAALIFWLYWIGLTRSNESNQQTVACFGFPGILQFIIQLINLCIFTNWMPFVTLPLLFIALRNFKAADPVTRDLFYGLGLTIVFYFFFLLDQGHGWGYRYLNPVLGNVLLLSSLGLVKSSEKTALWSRMTLCAILIAFFIQLPIRCFEVRQFVQKFALPYQKISKLDADFVIIDSSNIWYGNELVRNDPYFQNRPLLLLNQHLSEENLKQLNSQQFKIEMLQYDDLIKLGLPSGPNLTEHFDQPNKKSPSPEKVL
jgi:hypothetical protein